MLMSWNGLLKKLSYIKIVGHNIQYLYANALTCEFWLLLNYIGKGPISKVVHFEFSVIL